MMYGATDTMHSTVDTLHGVANMICDAANMTQSVADGMEDVGMKFQIFKNPFLTYVHIKRIYFRNKKETAI